MDESEDEAQNPLSEENWMKQNNCKFIKYVIHHRHPMTPEQLTQKPFEGILTEFHPSLNSCASHSCDIKQFWSLYTKNRGVISVMGSPIDVGGWYPFITFFTPPRLSGKFLLWCDEASTVCK